MQIVSKHYVLSKPAFRPFCLETIVYSPIPLFFLLPWHTTFRAQRGNFFDVYFLFLWIAAEEGRARSAETFSIYYSLSYELRKKKEACSAETFSKLTSILLKLA